MKYFFIQYLLLIGDSEGQINGSRKKSKNTILGLGLKGLTSVAFPILLHELYGGLASQSSNTD